MIVDYTPVEATEAQQFAAGLAKRAQQVADQVVQLYRYNFEMLWHREGWDVSKVQAVADEMGAAFIVMMQKNGALGQFIATNYPGQVPEQELASPVSYEIVGGRLVFDPEGIYPGPQSEA